MVTSLSSLNSADGLQPQTESETKSLVGSIGQPVDVKVTRIASLSSHSHTMANLEEPLIPIVMVVSIYAGIALMILACHILHRCLGMELPCPYDEGMAGPIPVRRGRPEARDE